MPIIHLKKLSEILFFLLSSFVLPYHGENVLYLFLGHESMMNKMQRIKICSRRGNGACMSTQSLLCHCLAMAEVEQGSGAR